MPLVDSLAAYCTVRVGFRVVTAKGSDRWTNIMILPW